MTAPIDTPVVTLKNPEDGMPEHPFIKGFPVIWAEPHDEWLFRFTTNILVPKAVETLSPEDNLVRYTTCAIKRALSHGGGYDMVIWMENESIQPENKTSVVVPILCFGPSRMSHIAEVNDTIDAAMIAFKEVYRDPRWIVQFDYRDSSEKPSNV